MYASYFLAGLLDFSEEAADDIMKDFGIVTIFFSELSYEKIESEKAYDIESLWCDIGGAFGLILGSTLLTLIEIGDFLVTEAWGRLFRSPKIHQQAKMFNVQL